MKNFNNSTEAFLKDTESVLNKGPGNKVMPNFEDELKNLDDLKNYLQMNSVEIDQCNKERKEIRTK